MRSSTGAAMTPLDKTVGRLRELRDRMTPGQRWTYAVAAIFVLSTLAFGQARPRLNFASAPARGELQPSRASALPPSEPFESTIEVGGAVVQLAPVTDRELGRAEPSPPRTVERPTTVPTSAPEVRPVAPAVAAVTTRSGTPLPGRTTAEISHAFASRADFPIRSFEAGASDSDCAPVATAADIVLVSEDVPTKLVECLVAAGRLVLGHLPAGPRPDADGRPGQVVSTRRGLSDSLHDLARWAVRTDRFGGDPVGLVAHSDDRERLEPLRAELERAGVDFREVVYLDGSASSLAGGIETFRAAAVASVVFAVPVAWQSEWAGAYRLVMPAASFFVSDAYDGVVNESYPSIMDGAIAHSSQRLSWYERAHGETDEQRHCREAWEAASPPGGFVDGAEKRRVYAWCQHVALAGALRNAVIAGTDLTHAGRAIRMPSPVTSDLGPLEGRSIGPVADAVLVWRLACVCWEEQRPFEGRRA